MNHQKNKKGKTVENFKKIERKECKKKKKNKKLLFFTNLFCATNCKAKSIIIKENNK